MSTPYDSLGPRKARTPPHSTPHLTARVQVGELWDRYIEAFDVVVVDDGDMSYVNDLLRDILAGGNRR